ncbi:MAG: hypothetical protein LUG16_03960, partial [Candidatus Gastranaerophilales bacterium]|nr:hypothetical protein [Candidatus Gastranaerophilales bacterium]
RKIHMYKNEKKVILELIKDNEERDLRKENSQNMCVSNPITIKNNNANKLSEMVTKVLNAEFPQLKNNSLLHNLVLEKLNTVQSVENVLSYIKESNVKEVKDVSFIDGEIFIKCSI